MAKKRQQYHLNLPINLHAALEEIAKEEDETLAAVMRKFLELGIEAYNLATGYPRMVDISDTEGKKTKTIGILFSFFTPIDIGV